MYLQTVSICLITRWLSRSTSLQCQGLHLRKGWNTLLFCSYHGSWHNPFCLLYYEQNDISSIKDYNQISSSKTQQKQSCMEWSDSLKYQMKDLRALIKMTIPKCWSYIPRPRKKKATFWKTWIINDNEDGFHQERNFQLGLLVDASRQWPFIFCYVC